MKNLIFILGILVVLALAVCVIIDFYVEPAVGLMVGFIFGFAVFFYWHETEKNKYEPIFCVSYYLFFGMELFFFALLIPGILFHYQIGILVGIIGLFLGILFGFLYYKFSKKII